MNDAKWQKYALIGGPLFVVLALVGTFLAGSPPAPDADAAKLTAFFNDNTSAIKTGAWIGLLAAIAILWWFATLWRHMTAAEGGRPRLALISFAGLVFAGAVTTIASALLAGMALRVDDLGNNVTILWGIFDAVSAAAAIGLGIYI